MKDRKCHANAAPTKKVIKAKKNVTFELIRNQQLSEINESMESLITRISELNNEFSTLREELIKVKNENCQLKQIINLRIYKTNASEQYGRRKNLQIHGILESADNNDDSENILFQIATILKIKLDVYDLQMARRIGKERKYKPRPVIVRFVNYKKRNEFMFQKSKPKDNQVFPKAFITENLTLLRAKLLNYVKNHCEKKFALCHTINGNIRMKKSVECDYESSTSEKDQGIEDWLVTSTPADLFKLDIDVD